MSYWAMRVVALAIVADKAFSKREIEQLMPDRMVEQLMPDRMVLQEERLEPVPKIIHVMFKTDLTEVQRWPNSVWKVCFHAWKKYFPEPEYVYHFWTDDAIDKFFREKCAKHYALFASFANAIYKSDLSRYCILKEIGGVYSDLDYEPRRNFYDDLQVGSVSILQSPYAPEKFQNALMASPIGPKFTQYWTGLLDQVELDHRSSPFAGVMQATGPGQLDKYPPNTHSVMVNILPCHEFQRRVKHDRWDSGLIKMGCDTLIVQDQDNVKGIHWVTGSWHTYKLEGEVDSTPMSLFHLVHPEVVSGAFLPPPGLPSLPLPFFFQSQRAVGVMCSLFLLVFVLISLLQGGAVYFESHDREAMSTQQLLLRGVAICVPCLGTGYNVAVIGTGLTSLKASFGISHNELGWVAASSAIGSIAGAVVCSSAVDIMGRLRVHFFLTFLLFIAQCVMSFSTTYQIFLGGRFLAGVACGCGTALAPLYLAEIAPKDRRGLLVSLTELMISGGLMLGFAAAGFQSFTFREYAFLGVVFPVVSLSLSPLLSESPRWLIQQGRPKKARAILVRYVPSIDEIEQTIKAASRSLDVTEQAEKQRSVRQILAPLLDYLLLFKDSATRGYLLLPAALSMFDEFVGIEVSDAYCVKLLEEAGVPSQFLIVTITTCTIVFKSIALIISGFLLDSWGRRPSLLFSLWGQAVSLIALGLAFPHGVWQVNALMWFFYNLFYGAGLGNVCKVVMAESFPDPKTRAIGISFCYTLNRLIAAVLTGFYPWQRTFMTASHVFFLWAACVSVGYIVSYFYFSERMGTILEDAD